MSLRHTGALFGASDGTNSTQIHFPIKMQIEFSCISCSITWIFLIFQTLLSSIWELQPKLSNVFSKNKMFLPHSCIIDFLTSSKRQLVLQPSFILNSQTGKTPWSKLCFSRSKGNCIYFLVKVTSLHYPEPQCLWVSQKLGFICTI